MYIGERRTGTRGPNKDSISQSLRQESEWGATTTFTHNTRSWVGCIWWWFLFLFFVFIMTFRSISFLSSLHIGSCIIRPVSAMPWMYKAHENECTWQWHSAVWVQGTPSNFLDPDCVLVYTNVVYHLCQHWILNSAVVYAWHWINDQYWPTRRGGDWITGHH